MRHRAIGFVSLLAVIGVSIAFGMLVGGRLNAPRVALAAPGNAPLSLPPATTSLPAVTDFADIVQRAMPAVVSVKSTQLESDEEQSERMRQRNMLWEWFLGPDHPQRQPGPPMPRIGEGSGFIISDDGYLLTNYHVVEDADRLLVGFSDGTESDAEVVGTDPSIDLALLKIDPRGAKLPTLPLGSSEELRVGEWVIAIGNPLEYEQTVTVGVVSAKKRRVPVGSTDSGVVTFIQTDAAINFGNSGGPLLDARGNVVGINTAIRRQGMAEGIGFALPIDHARRVIQQLRETGSVRRGYIGIQMNVNGLDETAAEWYGLPDTFGVIIDDVNPGGPADRAGIEEGDVIRKVDGERVQDNLDLISKIATRQPGEEVAVEFFRDGKIRTVRVTLEDREEGLSSQRIDPRRRERNEELEDDESVGLGFTVRTLSSQMRESLELDPEQRGVLVVSVEFDSPAAEKGVAPNVVIVSINNRPVRNLADWDEAVDKLRPGDAVKLDVVAPGGREFPVFLRVPSKTDD